MKTNEDIQVKVSSRKQTYMLMNDMNEVPTELTI